MKNKPNKEEEDNPKKPPHHLPPRFVHIILLNNSCVCSSLFDHQKIKKSRVHPSELHYLYILPAFSQEGKLEGIYKIGHTQCPKCRLTQYATHAYNPSVANGDLASVYEVKIKFLFGTLNKKIETELFDIIKKTPNEYAEQKRGEHFKVPDISKLRQFIEKNYEIERCDTDATKNYIINQCFCIAKSNSEEKCDPQHCHVIQGEFLKDKFKLCTKYMQTGKTQMLIDAIKSIRFRATHFVLCSNSLLLTAQTQTRADHFFNEEPEYQVIEISSKSKRKLSDIDNNIGKTLVVTCCTNKTRMDEILKYCQNGNKKSECIYIWIDEVHSGNVDGFIHAAAQLNNVTQIMGITATPTGILKRMGESKIEPVEACDKATYFGINDINIHEHEGKGPNDLEQYVEFIMKKHIKLTKGDCLFVPAKMKKDSHLKIAQILIKHGVCGVIIVNSNGIVEHSKGKAKMCALAMIQKKKGDKKAPETLGSFLGKLKTGKYLNKPIAITGFKCIGQGITLSDWDTNFNITKCIIGYDNAGIGEFRAQIVGRCFGNIKPGTKKKPLIDLYAKPSFIKSIMPHILAGALSEYAMEKKVDFVTAEEFIGEDNEWLDDDINEFKGGVWADRHIF